MCGIFIKKCIAMFGKICNLRYVFCSDLQNFPQSYFLRGLQSQISSASVLAWDWKEFKTVGELPDLKLEVADNLVSGSYSIASDLDAAFIAVRNQRVVLLVETKSGAYVLIGTPTTPVLVIMNYNLPGAIKSNAAYTLSFAIKQPFQPALLAV